MLPLLTPWRDLYITVWCHAQEVPLNSQDYEWDISRKVITILQGQDPTNIKWSDSGAKYVVWSAGIFTTMEKAVTHKRIIISVLSADVSMLVMDTDHEITHDCQQCLLQYQLLRPPEKGFHDSFGIIEGLMTTVPACSDTQTTVEIPDDYGTAQSIITESTGTTNASVKVSQELIGKIIGAMHPYPQTCSMDLTWHGKSEGSGKYDYLKKVVKQASESPQRGILNYTEDQIVSTNFNSNSYSSIADAGAGIAIDDDVVK